MSHVAHVGRCRSVTNGEFGAFSAAVDVPGRTRRPCSLLSRPGAIRSWPAASRGGFGGLLSSTAHAVYKLKIRWYTELHEESCFARWLIIPAQARD